MAKKCESRLNAHHRNSKFLKFCTERQCFLEAILTFKVLKLFDPECVVTQAHINPSCFVDHRAVHIIC
jgi:hypothetical protein